MKKLYAKLNPKTHNPDAVGGSSADALTPEMIAGAMAYIKEPCGALLLRVKWADQKSCLPALEKEFAEHLKSKMAEEGITHNRSIITIERIASAAIHEYVYKRCRACDGRGIVYRHAPNGGAMIQEVCPLCEGSCAYQLKKSDRYKAMEVSHSTYDRWHDRFEFAMRELARIEGFSNKAVRDALK